MEESVPQPDGLSVEAGLYAFALDKNLSRSSKSDLIGTFSVPDLSEASVAQILSSERREDFIKQSYALLVADPWVPTTQPLAILPLPSAPNVGDESGYASFGENTLSTGAIRIIRSGLEAS